MAFLHLSPVQLCRRYAAFALIATAINLAGQWLVLEGGWPGAWGLDPVWAALILGSILGLVTKYELDRRWVFGDDRVIGATARTGQFLLYATIGVATTALFWGVELFFLQIGGTTAWQLTGGGIGLILGYVAKYRLDRAFVFAGPA